MSESRITGVAIDAQMIAHDGMFSWSVTLDGDLIASAGEYVSSYDAKRSLAEWMVEHGVKTIKSARWKKR